MENESYEIDELEESALTPPRFVVETSLNAAVHMEAYGAAQSKALTIFSFVCLGLCAAMFVVLIVLFFITKNTGNLLYAALMLLTLAFMLYVKYVSPKKQRMRWEESIRHTFGSNELHLTTEFYELSLMQSIREDANNLVDAGYSELMEMKETENLFLIRCKNRQWFFLSKKGFKTGTAEEFREFITERMGGK